MDFSAAFFDTEKRHSFTTKYDTELKGAYYSAYRDRDGLFHMAKKDKESLKERIFYYSNVISRRPSYPAFYFDTGFEERCSDFSLIYFQTLGLPKEVLLKKDGTYYGPKEILSHILFDIDREEESYPLEEEERFFDSDHPSILKATNYLLENGFYFLDVNRIYDVKKCQSHYFYPVFVHEEKIPFDLIKERETSHKLIMDFSSDLLSITKDVYLKYYEPLDHMSLNELADLAFNDADLADPLKREMVIALRRYFCALVKKILNRYYRKYHSVRGMAGFTVLDQDFECYNFNPRFLYIGRQFNMGAMQYRTFSLKEDGLVYQKFEPKDYRLAKEDIPFVEEAFNLVKGYFQNHPEFAYIPSVFLALMGLPYPAFEKMKYFDFENGSEKSFIRFFNKTFMPDYYSMGLLLPLLSREGNQIRVKYRNEYNSIYFKMRKSSSFFLTDPTAFNLLSNFDFLASFDHVRGKNLLSIIEGNAQFYESELNLFSDWTEKHIGDAEYLIDFKSLIVKYQKKGIIEPIHLYFSYLKKGYSSFEARDKVLLAFSSLDWIIFIQLIQIVICWNCDPKGKKIIQDTSSNIHEKRFFRSAMEEGEVFYDPFLRHPYVFKGKYFYVYGDSMDGPYYVDSDDKKAISNYLFLREMYFLNSGLDIYPLFVFGNSFPYFCENPYSPLGRFSFGLPKRFMESLSLNDATSCDNFFSQICFEDGISIFHDPRQKKMMSEDESLYYPVVFAQTAREGFLLLSKGEWPIGFWHLLTRNKEIDYFFQLEYIKAISFNKDLRDKLAKYCFRERKPYSVYSSIVSRDYSMIYHNPFMGFNDDIKEPQCLEYISYLMKNLYQITYQKIFDVKGDYYFGFYKRDGLNIAPGKNFNMFSDEEDFSSFGFLKEDIPYFLSAFHALKQNQKPRSLENKVLELVYFLGIPEIYKVRLYQCLMENKLELKEEDLPIYKGEKRISEDRLRCYQSPFRAIEKKEDIYLDSFAVHRKALKEGLFLASETDISTQEMMDCDDDGEIEKLLELCEDNRLVILNSMGEKLKSFLCPEEVSFVRSAKNFFSYNVYKYGKAFAFYAQEALIYCYHMDSFFVVNSINFAFSDKEQFDCYLKKILKNYFSLVGKKRVTFDEIKTAFLSFFLKQLGKVILELKDMTK